MDEKRSKQIIIYNKMKTLNNKRIRNSLMLLLVTVYVAVSCSRIYDNIEEYVDGEIIYIDRLDGIIQVQIGFERVEIDLLKAGRIPSSQIRMAKATKTVIECEDFDEPGHRRVIDSICSWVNVTGLTQLKYYDLTIYTEDDNGNRSLSFKTSVRPYTQENLLSLEITPPTINAASSSAQIEWLDGISALTHQVLSFQSKYTDRDGIVITDGLIQGDRPVIFVENVLSEVDIPITLDCRVIPTIANPDLSYTPIIDTLDFHPTFSIRLSAEAGDVIFLKAPAPGAESDLTDETNVVFAWTKVAEIDAYTIKFSLLPNFPETSTYTLDVGDVNEWTMDNDDILDVVNQLEGSYFTEFFWTVTPTEQETSVKTSFRLIRAWKVGMYYEIDRSGWLALNAPSELSGYPLIQAIDGNLATFWHTSGVDLPHWFIVDMRTPQSVFKFDVLRTPSTYEDTREVELYLGNSPDVIGVWTKIGEGAFTPGTNGNTQPRLEVITTDNVTQGRYLRLNLLNGRVGSTNPYVNVCEIYLYQK